MKKLLIALAVVTSLTLTLAPAAQAVPHFGATLYGTQRLYGVECKETRLES